MEYPKEITQEAELAPMLKTAFRIGAGTALQQVIRRTESQMTPIEFLRMVKNITDELEEMK